MEQFGAKIVLGGENYEEAVLLSQKRAEEESFYDANPGGANTSLQLRAYGEIAYEIYDELRDAPTVISVPVSNGTTLAGIYRGFTSLYRRGKTSKMPKIVGGSSFNKNPIIHAFLKNLTTCEDLRPDTVRETRINEPLVNWHSIDGNPALDAIYRTQGWAGNASDKNMNLYSKIIREKEGFHVLPASTAGLIALVEKHRQQPLPSERYVAILTGRKA